MSHRVWLAAAGALGALGVLLAHLTTTDNGILGAHDRLLAEILAWWAVWMVAVTCVRRAPRRSAVVLIVVVAAGMRVAALSAAAPLSNDLYRYSWDAQVQSAGIDPYRDAPTAPELSALRDPWLWPSATTCAQLGRSPGCTRINRPSAHTIYPPLAQAWFLGVHAAGASRLQDVGWELAGMAVDLAVIGLILVLLRRLGRDPRWAVVYAWSPLAVLEAVQNAHVDALAALAVLAAVAVVGRRPAAAAAALAAAALIKLYPLLLMPALLRRRAGRAIAAAVVVIAVAYLPHLVAAGTQVLGYLPGYLSEEQYSAGSRYLLLDLIGLHGSSATVVAVVLVVAATGWAAWAVRRPDPVPVDAAMRVVFAVALLVATPVQPWYGLSLAALAALAGQMRWLATSVASYVLYFAVIPAGPNSGATHLGELVFAAAAALLLAACWAERRAAGRPPAAAGVRRVHNGAAASSAFTIGA